MVIIEKNKTDLESLELVLGAGNGSQQLTVDDITSTIYHMPITLEERKAQIEGLIEKYSPSKDSEEMKSGDSGLGRVSNRDYKLEERTQLKQRLIDTSNLALLDPVYSSEPYSRENLEALANSTELSPKPDFSEVTNIAKKIKDLYTDSNSTGGLLNRVLGYLGLDTVKIGIIKSRWLSGKFVQALKAVETTYQEKLHGSDGLYARAEACERLCTYFAKNLSQPLTAIHAYTNSADKSLQEDKESKYFFEQGNQLIKYDSIKEVIESVIGEVKSNLAQINRVRFSVLEYGIKTAGQALARSLISGYTGPIDCHQGDN